MTPARAIAGITVAIAPAPALARDPQAWSTLSATVSLGDRWRIGGDLSGRTEANERDDQLLARAQIGRELSKRVTLWLGYVRVETLNDRARDGLEQRATGQLDATLMSRDRWRVVARTRLEARMVRGRDETSWRLRQQLRLVRTVGRLEASAGVEPFVALNRTATAPRRFEQLRFTANLLLPLTRRASIDVGYINQRLNRSDGRVVNHVVPVTLRLTL